MSVFDETTMNYVGLGITVETEDQLPQAIREIFLKSLARFERECDRHRFAGIPTREVVIRIGDEKRELSFQEFREEYLPA